MEPRSLYILTFGRLHAYRAPMWLRNNFANFSICQESSDCMRDSTDFVVAPRTAKQLGTASRIKIIEMLWNPTRKRKQTTRVHQDLEKQKRQNSIFICVRDSEHSKISWRVLSTHNKTPAGITVSKGLRICNNLFTKHYPVRKLVKNIPCK